GGGTVEPLFLAFQQQYCSSKVLEENPAGQFRGQPPKKNYAAEYLGRRMSAMQFTAFLDPCDQWMVYDLFSDLPAELPGRLLLGLTQNDAEQLTEQANMEFVSMPTE
ncbi:hypothetical protein, partial [Mesorhizobium sp. M1E.F.Ca.ET.041.01.1.1]|uniref:hypothetical protein n=1 Tax=Mesorhizobium sp. M1E.F.Ca.ET.041.01.1.1 TaxID=2496759 RepID=UPI001AECF70C